MGNPFTKCSNLQKIQTAIILNVIFDSTSGGFWALQNLAFFPRDLKQRILYCAGNTFFPEALYAVTFLKQIELINITVCLSLFLNLHSQLQENAVGIKNLLKFFFFPCIVISGLFLIILSSFSPPVSGLPEFYVSLRGMSVVLFSYGNWKKACFAVQKGEREKQILSFQSS